jgi:hypothetical protein
MAWRLAYSLEELRDEVNARWPNRNKASDGTIGDASHAATPSDHNPNAAGVVCAFDITNDPVNGPSAQYLFDTIRANPQLDAKYIIANRQIASRTHGWTARSYTGSDPHTSHIHVSVGVGSDGQSVEPYDDRNPWLSSIPSPEPSKGNEKVLHLIVGTKDGKWWLTDWITKRYVQTPAEAAQIIVSTVKTGGSIEQNGSNGPVTYDQAVVDAIPVAD